MNRRVFLMTVAMAAGATATPTCLTAGDRRPAQHRPVRAVTCPSGSSGAREKRNRCGACNGLHRSAAVS
jgi:hypothetical protein